MRLVLRMAASIVAMSLGVASASADTIRITSGALVFPSDMHIAIDFAGDGFAFTGSSLRMEMGFSPYQSCLVTACVPGSTLSLHSFGTEQNFRFDAVTYQGRTFTNLSGVDARSSVQLDWNGSLPIPSNFSGGTLTAPFVFSGVFRLTDDEAGVFHAGNLVGSGIATVTFDRYGSPEHPNAFATSAVRFDFADAAPTPEPMSLLLVATGMGVIGVVRRRRRHE